MPYKGSVGHPEVLDDWKSPLPQCFYILTTSSSCLCFSSPAQGSGTSSSASSSVSSQATFSTNTSASPPTASASAGTTNTATTAAGGSSAGAPGGPVPSGQPPTAAAELQFSQLLGNILGAAGSSMAGVAGVGSPTITVAMPGVPAFLQGMTDFLQVSFCPFSSPGPACYR